MRLIIDRVEGDYAICFNPENNDTFQVNTYMLPAGIKDGDVVVSKDGDLVIDKKYKEVLLNRIKNLKSKVWKR